ncbi:hypothetical protein EDB85DRAFT_598267 [Lactarius pseudohatsudake]|nr:hypothetical protein EDB85DRAFT_598267 [Lactarius pseudohatsudake]
MRAFIFDGFRRFGTLARAVTPITRHLHISVFLFFASLVEFLSRLCESLVCYSGTGFVRCRREEREGRRSPATRHETFVAPREQTAIVAFETMPPGNVQAL